MRNLEDAKWLSKEEITNNREDEKYKDEIALQTIDLDYDTIHSEILENIILDENDSAISDFDTKEEENPKKKTFEITKIKTLIHKNVKLLFANYQEDDQYNPLIQLESKKIKKEIINEENEKENGANVLSTNNEIKTLSLGYKDLKNIDSAYAITIHKSQGSEYDQVVIALTDDADTLLCRELLYTAITRTSKKVTIIATENSLNAALSNTSNRVTFLSKIISDLL